MNLLHAAFGRPLANDEQDSCRIGWFAAVPAMGLDGLGSASYGPEAALTVMIPVGAAGLQAIGWITVPIVALLLLLYLSYRQTIIAYPSNGGAYTVAKENLGRRASLVAAAALMIDYVLNVAVGISAGVGALTSAFPSLHPYTLALCLGVLALVTVLNLRGSAEAGWAFALPTYVFIASFVGLTGVGVWRLIASGGAPHAIVAPPPVGPATQALGAWILLRAFAAGCTAMTGVEAVSNGVSAFKPPVIAQAHRTLSIICLTLGVLLAGVAAVSRGYGLAAMDQTKPHYQSVLSQLAGAMVGHGPIYYVAMTSLLAVLCLSANTSYVGFPRICKLVAQDGFLPRPFAVADRRLVFSVGIVFLTGAAGALLIAFDGVTDRLIPLFAIGAFLTFTLSQIGMVAHWRNHGPGDRGRLAINALGAATTLAAFAVVLTAKFLDGAWIVVLAGPAIVALLMGVRHYYDHLEAKLSIGGPFTPGARRPPTVIVAFAGRDRAFDRALELALDLSSDVVAVHLTGLDGPDTPPDTPQDERRVRETWTDEIERPLAAQGLPMPRLVILPAPFRELEGPLLAYIATLDAVASGRRVVVLISEFVPKRVWERLLHGRRLQRLRNALISRGGPRLSVVTIPWES